VGVLYTLTQDVDELSWLKSNPVTKPGVKWVKLKVYLHNPTCCMKYVVRYNTKIRIDPIFYVVLYVWHISCRTTLFSLASVGLCKCP
jgi:hypothetical protein